METQEQNKKLPLWVRLVIYITLFLLIGLAITWILNQLSDVRKSWSNNRPYPGSPGTSSQIEASVSAATPIGIESNNWI